MHSCGSEPSCPGGAAPEYRWAARSKGDRWRHTQHCPHHVLRLPQSLHNFLGCLNDYAACTGEEDGAHVLLYGDSILRGSFVDLGWTEYDPATSWQASADEVVNMTHVAPLMLRRTFADEGTGNTHVFDYLHRTAFGPNEVNARNVYVYGSQAAVMRPSADFADSFFKGCAANPQWSCGNYSTIFVAVGQWEKLFLNSFSSFEAHLELLLRSLKRHQPRARLVLRLATPAMCLAGGDYCNSSRFAFQRRHRSSPAVTNDDYNADIEKRYNPAIRAAALRFGAAVDDTWGVWSSYPVEAQQEHMHTLSPFTRTHGGEQECPTVHARAPQTASSPPTHDRATSLPCHSKPSPHPFPCRDSSRKRSIRASSSTRSASRRPREDRTAARSTTRRSALHLLASSNASCAPRTDHG